MKHLRISSMIPRLLLNRSLFLCSTLGLVALLASACVPIPHFIQFAPAIKGQIFRNGTPAKSVEVKLIDSALIYDLTKDAKLVDPDPTYDLINDGCNNLDLEETYTDSEGKFFVKETSEFELIMLLLPTDRWSDWALCLTFPDGARAIWYDGSWGGGPNLQHLSCRFGEELKTGEVLHIDNLNGGESSEENPITSYLCHVYDE